MRDTESSGVLPPSMVIWGRVLASDGARIRVGGLGQLACIGDRLRICRDSDGALEAEVIAIDGSLVIGLLLGPAEGLRAGLKARLIPLCEPTPTDEWLGHVVNAFGQREGADDALDIRLSRDQPPGRTGKQSVASRRRPLGPAISTGVAACDTLLPVCRGQRIGIFAGSGVGKSTLLRQFATGAAAEVVVLALIGERGREIAEFSRDLLSGARRGNTVIIAASSEEPALVRRRAAQLAITTAEHFRDQGRHVLLLFDSITRLAEAHREVALAAGETASLRAFPTSTASLVAGLCERTGPGWSGDRGGDITALFTVLVAGSDMDEPIADMLRGVLDGHVILDRSIAERGRFPAIDLRRSVSRSAPAAWSPREAELCRRARVGFRI